MDNMERLSEFLVSHKRLLQEIIEGGSTLERQEEMIKTLDGIRFFTHRILIVNIPND